MTAFSLGADITNQPRSTTVYSSVGTISGAPLDASFTAGGDPSSQLSINGGPWINALRVTGDCNGQSIQVRHTSASGFSTAVTTTVSEGGVAVDSWSSTTEAADSRPDHFTYATINNAEPGALCTSEAHVLTGFNSAPVNDDVNVGEMQVNGGAWAAGASFLYPNDSVKVRANASASFGGSVVVSLRVDNGAETIATLTINTRAADTTPNAFAFTDQSSVPASTVRTSNTITVTGIEAAANVTFSTSGGTAHEYSKNGGAWTAVGNTTINNNDTLAVRMTSPGTAGQVGNITVTIGGVSDIFSVTTANPDSTPDPFIFVDNADVAKSTVATSNVITIAGIDTTSNVSFSTSGGSSHEYRKNGGAWTAVGATTVVNGDTLQVRLTVPGTAGQTGAITMTVGGVSDTYTATAQEPDTTPTAFSFTPATGVDPLTLTASDPVTVAGINTAAAISVSGGEYSVNGGAYTSSAGTVSAGDQVRARGTSAAALTTTVNVTVTIGGVAGAFAITTRSPDVDSQYVVTFREASYGVAY